MSGLYRLLLRLYPASFRSEYGSELEHTFEQSVRDRGSIAAALACERDGNNPIDPDDVRKRLDQVEKQVNYE